MRRERRLPTIKGMYMPLADLWLGSVAVEEADEVIWMLTLA